MEEQERDSLRVDVKNAYAERFKATVDSAATAVDSEHSRAIRPLDSTDEKLYNAGGDSGAHPSTIPHHYPPLRIVNSSHILTVCFVWPQPGRTRIGSEVRNLD